MFVKSVIGFGISLAMMFVFMPILIKKLKKNQLSQTVSEYALDEFKAKNDTPIMGGLLFVIIPTIVFCIIDFKSLLNHSVQLILLSYVLFCIPGFIDDLLILKRHNNDGLSPITKLVLEAIFVVVLLFIYKNSGILSYKIYFTNHYFIEIGFVLLLIISLIMYLGEANAVNFTDGMDGLCASCSIVSIIGFIFISMFYSQSDIVIYLSCILGSLFGYLKFNWHPAKIFMGDSGSLALGGLFASLALVLSKEVSLLFIGGVFLIEMICVCLQQVSMRLFHKRIFKYTPIHYTFTLIGYKEPQIVLWFSIAQAVMMIIGVIIGII